MSGRRGGRGAVTAREAAAAVPFVVPLVLCVGGVIVLPVLGTIFNSVYQDTAFLPRVYVGVEHYRELWADAGFRQALRFTLLFILVSVPLEMVVGLGFALLLNDHIPARGALRACLLIPWAIPIAIAARMWELIYNVEYGLANFLVQQGGLSAEPINWLGSSTAAFLAVVVADAWKTTPFVTIILLAGLSALPEELYSQARVDGATLVQRFGRITLPLLRPVLLVALLFRTIDALRVFDMVFVLTNGGPGGATTSVSLYAYNAFLVSDFGYGSAISVIVFVIAFGLALAYVRVGRFQTQGL